MKMKKKFIIMATLGMTSCSDMPYKEQSPIIEQSNKIDLKEYSFSGMVELGTPVNGATIEAYQFSGLSKGEKVGEAVSNRDGTFNLNCSTGYDGPLLLISKGGTYRDITTGETIAFKPNQELSS